MLSGVISLRRQCLESSNVRVDFVDVSRDSIACMGMLEKQKFVRGAETPQTKKKAIVREETLETQDCVSRQDMELDGDKKLEEIDFVPSANDEFSRGSRM